jgi:hypothetical protein
MGYGRRGHQDGMGTLQGAPAILSWDMSHALGYLWVSKGAEELKGEVINWHYSNSPIMPFPWVSSYLKQFRSQIKDGVITLNLCYNSFK